MERRGPMSTTGQCWGDMAGEGGKGRLRQTSQSRVKHNLSMETETFLTAAALLGDRR